jgi:hypothetical protein
MSNLLLEWMSFRGNGRLDELPAELTTGPPRRVLDDLSMLGHVETLTGYSWRIAPPALAGLSSDDESEHIAVLCGARTPGLLAHLVAACRSAGTEMDVTAIPNRPSIVRIRCRSTTALATIAAEAAIPLQSNAAYTLLACLPAIRNWPRTPCAMVAGRVDTVQRFSRSQIRWVTSCLGEATAARTGFFRIKRDWDWVSILKSSETDCAYIDDRAGRMTMAYRLRAASWDAASRTFSLPIQLYPPAIIARALTLCTGALPQFDGAARRLSFGGVSPAMLRLALSITGLRLA